MVVDIIAGILVVTAVLAVYAVALAVSLLRGGDND